jgi:hypothetical protein
MNSWKIGSKKIKTFIMTTKTELTHQIHNEALDWYKTAEKKAEILLGLIGTFIVFASGIILSNPGDIEKIITRFNPLIWTGLALTFSAMLFALFCAYQCLKSRMHHQKDSISPKAEIYYPLEKMYFFQHHADHEPYKLSESLKQINDEKEISIYSYQIVALSRNVAHKHRWINKGLVAVCCCILLMLLTTILYMLQFVSLNT